MESRTLEQPSTPRIREHLTRVGTDNHRPRRRTRLYRRLAKARSKLKRRDGHLYRWRLGPVRECYEPLRDMLDEAEKKYPRKKLVLSLLDRTGVYSLDNLAFKPKAEWGKVGRYKPRFSTLSKPIVCVTTGVVYRSIRETARRTDLTPELVVASCRTGQAVKGLLFREKKHFDRQHAILE